MAKRGRPSKFTEELWQEICVRLMDGEGLRKICRDKHMPERVNVYRWLHKSEELSNQYARAREKQADTYFEEALEIADNCYRDTLETEDGKFVANHARVQRDRLRVDTRKWAAGKLKGQYSDKTKHEVTGPEGKPIPVLNVFTAPTTKHPLSSGETE